MARKLCDILLASFRVVKVEIITDSDDGILQHHHGCRVQHNHSRGPMKGGLRCHGSVDEDEATALANLRSERQRWLIFLKVVQRAGSMHIVRDLKLGDDETLVDVAFASIADGTMSFNFGSYQPLIELPQWAHVSRPERMNIRLLSHILQCFLASLLDFSAARNNLSLQMAS